MKGNWSCIILSQQLPLNVSLSFLLLTYIVAHLIYHLSSFVTGVIARERVPSFERLLWRACRGNVFFKQAEIETPLEDPSTGDQVNKCVFIIFFQGDQLKSRVKKICEGWESLYYLLILCNLSCCIIDVYAYFIILSNTDVGVLMSLNPGFIMSYWGI